MPLVTAKDDRPTISVIVPSYNSRRTLARCLDALCVQECEADYEILVVDSSDDGTAELVEEKYPQVRLIRYAKKTLPGKARNRGAREARGSILACTDADCVAPPQWLRRHYLRQRDWDVVGGALSNANPRSLVGWASYLTEFAGFTPCRKFRPARNLITANVSYKREVLEETAFLEDIFPGEDTVFHWTVSGIRACCLDSSIVVGHLNRTKFRDYLAHQARIGSASVLVRGQVKLGVFGKVYARCPLLALLTPFFRLPLVALRLLRDTPSLLPKVILSSPLMFLGMTRFSLAYYQQVQALRRRTAQVQNSPTLRAPLK